MALPGVRLSELTDVQSHVQALGQCRRTLRGLGLNAVIGADTAGSARQVAEAGERHRAAIASRLAADIYGLEILKSDCEDEAHNTTRFIILSPEAAEWPARGTPTVTSFVFRVRNVPAALYKALGGFATNGVNMTKLESYQLEGQFYASQFYADVEAHPEDQSLRNAMEELAFFSHEVRMLGCYPASPFREKIREPDPSRSRPFA
jgi:prephenate dehydratase